MKKNIAKRFDWSNLTTNPDGGTSNPINPFDGYLPYYPPPIVGSGEPTALITPSGNIVPEVLKFKLPYSSGTGIYIPPKVAGHVDEYGETDEVNFDFAILEDLSTLALWIFIDDYNLKITVEELDKLLPKNAIWYEAYEGHHIPFNAYVDEDYTYLIEETLNAKGYKNEDGITETYDFNNTSIVGIKKRIPQCIKLDDGSEITVNFGITRSDGKSANQEVGICLIDALVYALECTGEEYQIESIYISATTNGIHNPVGNHSRALAIDLSRINGIKMAIMTSVELNLVRKLQECLEDYEGIRENFGSSIKKKLNENYVVGDHNDHIHFSVNSYHTCGFNVEHVKCR